MPVTGWLLLLALSEPFPLSKLQIVVDRTGTTLKVVIRTLKLFILGIFLQGKFVFKSILRSLLMSTA